MSNYKDYEKDLQNLKKMLIELSEPHLKEIKAMKSEDRDEEIDCMISTQVLCDIFEKELDDKEWEIFYETYYYMLYYAPAIEETLSILKKKINERS